MPKLRVPKPVAAAIKPPPPKEPRITTASHLLAGLAAHGLSAAVREEVSAELQRRIRRTGSKGVVRIAVERGDYSKKLGWIEAPDGRDLLMIGTAED